ncbi:hypothetical protein FRUB_06612 [Fimbriiglobus ruber]|uniref:Uncharacterized protein n=1 Tax=Fimbriiglobus ruber TaxID=1908690 RepID=A0A225D7R7_9BACT|nr:hypothetical protein FRUB_06612 [Fimbriiglobus ruber]
MSRVGKKLNPKVDRTDLKTLAYKLSGWVGSISQAGYATSNSLTDNSRVASGDFRQIW